MINNLIYKKKITKNVYKTAKQMKTYFKPQEKTNSKQIFQAHKKGNRLKAKHKKS